MKQTDIFIKFRNQIYPSDAKVVYNRSPGLLVLHEDSDNSQLIITDNVSEEAFVTFLNYMHGKNCNSFDMSLVYEIKYLAKKYDFESLLKEITDLTPKIPFSYRVVFRIIARHKFEFNYSKTISKFANNFSECVNVLYELGIDLPFDITIILADKNLRINNSHKVVQYIVKNKQGNSALNICQIKSLVSNLAKSSSLSNLDKNVLEKLFGNEICGLLGGNGASGFILTVEAVAKFDKLKKRADDLLKNIQDANDSFQTQIQTDYTPLEKSLKKINNELEKNNQGIKKFESILAEIKKLKV